jgi:hypothetical protein
MWGTLYNERTGRLQLLLAFTSTVMLRSSARTAYKTLFPTVLLLSRADPLSRYLCFQPLASSGQFLLAPLFWPFSCHDTIWLLPELLRWKSLVATPVFILVISLPTMIFETEGQRTAEIGATTVSLYVETGNVPRVVDFQETSLLRRFQCS